uniref:Uncharacterized protein n=1 Tax=Arundo donax TaxID=35708 RepID=A0A0A9DCC8_ARUDO
MSHMSVQSAHSTLWYLKFPNCCSTYECIATLCSL